MEKRSSFYTIIVVILLLVVGFSFSKSIKTIIVNYFYRPCSQPITYSIGNFDGRFDISKQEFIKDISQAVKAWQAPIGKTLFKYDPAGKLKINLVYDKRQNITQELQQMNNVLTADKQTYNNLNSDYKNLLDQYNNKKIELESLVAEYKKEEKNLEVEISLWNKKGGAPKEQYESINQRRDDLQDQLTAINKKTDSFNQLVNEINSMQKDLNQAANEHNTEADKFK